MLALYTDRLAWHTLPSVNSIRWSSVESFCIRSKLFIKGRWIINSLSTLPSRKGCRQLFSTPSAAAHPSHCYHDTIYFNNNIVFMV